ncbi:SCO1/SenC [compost metagenome]
MKNFSIKKILILVTILAVPGFLYYLLQEKGKNRYRPLAIYGPKVVAKTFHSVRGEQIPDTIYHEVPDFGLINQNDESISWENYKGKIILLNLFHTNGGSNTIDFSSKAMEEFNQLYHKNTMLHLISLSVNPEHDSVSVLLNYAAQLNATPGKWDLLTGNRGEMYDLIKKGLFLDAVEIKQDNETKFEYSKLFVLLDSQHRIRGYYDSTHKEALSKLDDEIKVLIAEEVRNSKDGR